MYDIVEVVRQGLDLAARRSIHADAWAVDRFGPLNAESDSEIVEVGVVVNQQLMLNLSRIGARSDQLRAIGCYGYSLKSFREN